MHQSIPSVTFPWRAVGQTSRDFFGGRIPHPRAKRKFKTPTWKSVLKPQTQDIFLKYSLGMPDGHAWKFTKFWESAKSERLLVKVWASILPKLIILSE